MSRARFAIVACLAVASPPVVASLAAAPQVAATKSEPLVVGETFTVDSKAFGETRRVNVYLPPAYSAGQDTRLPVLYMPDGGLGEDFLHVAGLLQISMANQTMRPFLLVGIENTQRRRDLTGPTTNAEDRKIAPVVGGSAAFRSFLRGELMPEVARRYRTTGETAIIGESLAGLFVVETLLLEPDLFQTYVAVDPSLWWNNGELIAGAAKRLAAASRPRTTLFIATSGEPGLVDGARRLVAELQASNPASLEWRYEPMPGEGHGTVFHPAALAAVRTVFAPPATAQGN